MSGGAPYRDDGVVRTMLRAVIGCIAACLALATTEPAAAGTGDLEICLTAKPTLGGYSELFVRRGWTPVPGHDADHARATRATAEIIGTLRTFPAAFAEPGQVREQLARILEIGRVETSAAEAALLAKDGLWLMVVLDTRSTPSRLTCYLSANALPDVTRRLPQPGRNPSGEPLAYNVMSTGALDTAHVFAEIMYVRLFFQPAQHLLTGGAGIVTHLTFHREATSI